MVSSMRLGQGKKQIERESVCEDLHLTTNVSTDGHESISPMFDQESCWKTAITMQTYKQTHHARVHTHCKHLLHCCLSTPHIPYQDNHSCTFKNRNNLTLTIFTLLLSQHTSSNSHNLKRMCIPWKKADR